ncbi:DUF4328 domain-containing protein [Myxococcus xanthus]|uniref:DUF4328 domain-containing protein n=1 Tax=Myxococcus xanthus TaxID=34 RepID=A0A7Y4IIL0_MYXXA|nr:DUF4328 domain-containing protein [Myxococcus xanthus]NOJ86524.1 DUF4328 domain-containing protein [Myxococcus xanthus]
MLTESAVPETAPVCPDHAGEPSTGTCERCGRFICAKCRTAQAGVCAACSARQVQALPLTRARTRWASVALAASAVLAVPVAVLNLWLYLRFDNGSPSIEDAESFDQLNALLALPALLTMLATVVLYLRWLRLSVKTANALGLSNESTGWATFCWFIPFANLFKPLEVVRDLWQGLGGPPERQSMLTAWWATWILSNIISNVGSTFARADAASPTSLSVSLLAGILSEGLSIAAAVLCIRVIRDIESLLVARRTEAEATLNGATP